MKHLLYTIIFVFVWGVGFANPNNSLLDTAAQHYITGNYELAIASYESILKEGSHAAELYFNLGNAYYKSNKIPLAIVNYERALKLKSTDADVNFNLKLANMHVVDKIEVIPEFFITSWRNKLISVIDSNTWAYLSMGAFVVALLLLAMFFLSSRVILRKVSFWLGMVMIVLSLLSFSYSRKLKWFSEQEPAAVVLTPSVIVKSSPDQSGTELFLIHEGLKVKVTDKLGDWREIRLSDGNKGWLKTEDIIVI